MPDSINPAPSDGWMFRLMKYFKRTSHPRLDSDDGKGGRNRDDEFRTMLDKVVSSRDRGERNKLLKQMADYTLVGAIVATYAEEATQVDSERGRTVWLTSTKAPSSFIDAGITALDNVMIEDRAYGHCYNIALYGEIFRRMVYASGQGVLGSKHVDSHLVSRHDDKYDRLIGFKQANVTFGKAKKSISFPWDYVHGRMLEAGDNEPYGTSMVASLWRESQQMAMGMDAISLFRQARVPDRAAFMVETDGLSESEEQDVLEDVRKKVSKQEFIDQTTGQYRTWWTPFTGIDNIVLGRAQGRSISIETVPGTGEVGSMADMDMTRRLLLGKARMPGAYIGFEGDLNCVALDTRIPLLSGETKTLRQIIDTFERTGYLPYVYAWDKASGKIVPGKVLRAAVTRRNAEVLEVELDDGTKIRTTPDHRWFKLDGSEVRADKLSTGDQLMPLRRKRERVSYKSPAVYERVYDPYGGSARTHRRVAETLYADTLAAAVDPDVHHLNRRPLDNDPRNLSIMESADHLAEHQLEFTEAMCAHNRKHGPWNKGLRKSSGDPRAMLMRPTNYVQKECRQCGVAMRRPMTQKDTVFCSSACAWKWGNKPRVDEGRTDTKCEGCGETFSTTKSRILNGRAKFCSRECRSYALAMRRTKSCRYCGEEFDPQTKTKRRFCSVACSNTYMNKRRAGKIPLPNHTVVAVRKMEARIDTGDIEVERYSNFFIADSSNGGVLVHNSKTGLSMQDVRMARMVKRLRRSFVKFIRSITDMHYMLLGDKFSIMDGNNPYTIEMAPISYLDEMDKVELLRMRNEIVTGYAQLAQMLRIDPVAWTRYILVDFAKIPESQVDKLISKVDPAAAEQAPMPNESINERIERWHHKGSYGLNPQEQKSAIDILRNSPLMQSTVRNLHQFLGENEEIDRAATQTDLSLFMPQVPSMTDDGRLTLTDLELNDSVDEAPERKDLNEAIQAAKKASEALKSKETP